MTESSASEHGEPGVSRACEGAPADLSAALTSPDGVTFSVLPGPVLEIDGRRLSWEQAGQLLLATSAPTVFWRLDPPPDAESDDPEEPIPDGVTLGPSLPLGWEVLAPLRDPIDLDEAEAWAEAVGLLNECLPVDHRPACPLEELRLAAEGARAGFEQGDELWAMVAEGAGWEDGPPDEDRDLWTGAAMCLVSVAVDTLADKLAESLDSMEPGDWLSTVVELARAGAGTPADAENLLALSARCLDVDSAAVDPGAATTMTVAFEAVFPVWRALGAVDRNGKLTALGAWGLPHALARAWAGSLRGPEAR